MSRDPLAPIWARLDSEPPVFFADRPEPPDAPDRVRLEALGFLRALEPAQFAVCTACGGGNVRLVRWVDDRQTGARYAYVPCPQCGRVRIDPAVLLRWGVDVPRLLAAVFAAAGGRAALCELVEGRLWYLGSATWLGRSRQVYFARAVHIHARPAVVAALTPHPRSVILFPTEEAVRLWGETTPNPVAALESIVTLPSDGVRFDARGVEGALLNVGAAPAALKPPRRRGPFAAKIERLVRELREHLRAARDHARATLELGGTPRLLPRPPQKELAARCALTESDVTRCLKDPEAQLLRLLWEAALDLDRILAWDGTVGAAPDG